LGAVGPGNGRMDMRILVILMLSGTLGILGCDSTSTGSAGSGGDGGSAGSGGEGGAAGGGGLDGGGGAGGIGASAAAIAFCNDYESVCTFGGVGRWEDEAACLNGFDTSGQSACYTTHLGLAGSDRGTHCPHAAGIDECL